MNQPEIRLMRSDDRERVDAFFAQMGSEARMFFNRGDLTHKDTLKFFEGGVEPNHRRWIAVDGDEMVGYIFLWDSGSMIPWMGTAVAERMRGKHFGQTLIETAEGWCREQGKGGILLTTHMANIRAQTLYERCGFEWMGVSKVNNELLYLKRF